MPLKTNEYKLRDYLRCPLSSLSERPSPLHDLVYHAVREIIRERMRRLRDFSREDIRRRLENGCAGLNWKQVIFMAVQIDELQSQFRILQPMTAYALKVAGCTFEGEYAVVQHLSRKKDISVLRLRGLHEDFQPARDRYVMKADIIDCLRLVHLHDVNQAECSILNYWLTRERYSYCYVDIDHARDAVRFAGRLCAADYRFPSPGSYCRACRRTNCREAPPDQDIPNGGGHPSSQNPSPAHVLPRV